MDSKLVLIRLPYNAVEGLDFPVYQNSLMWNCGEVCLLGFKKLNTVFLSFLIHMFVDNSQILTLRMVVHIHFGGIIHGVDVQDSS